MEAFFSLTSFLIYPNPNPSPKARESLKPSCAPRATSRQSYFSFTLFDNFDILLQPFAFSLKIGTHIGYDS